MKLHRFMLIAVGAFVLVAAAPEAQAAGTPITQCGQTVTTNAVLTQNLVCAGDGVIVGASGITIDLKGFRLRGDNGWVLRHRQHHRPRPHTCLVHGPRLV